MSRTRAFCTAFVVSFLFASASPVLAQVAVFQYRHVPSENIEEFIHLETTFWSAVAKKAIDDGKMEYWAMWQKVGGWNLHEGSNFLFVNVFKDTEALSNVSGIWDPTQVFPEMRPESIDTGRLSTVHHQIFVQSVADAGEMEPKFLRINYYDVNDFERFGEREMGWKEFVSERIANKKTDVTSWRYIQVMMPLGASIPFNAMTLDGSQTLSAALSPNWDPDTVFPDLSETNDTRTVDRIVTYALVKAVGGEE